MKLWRVNLPLLRIVWVCNLFVAFMIVDQLKAQSNLSNKQLNSITKNYAQSNSDSLSLKQRLSHISSFLEVAAISQNDSLIYKGLMQKTWLLGKSQQFDSAIFYTHLLNDLAYKNKDTIHIQKALTKLGIYYKKNNQLIEAFRQYNEKFKICRVLGDSLNAGKSLLQMANIQTSLGDYSGSKTTAVDGVVYLENTNNLRNLAGLYHIISVANRVQKNYNDAIKYNEKAIGLGVDSASIRIIGTKNILIFKNTKALILANQEKYKQAIIMLKELASNSLVKQTKKEYARVISNLGYIKWLENKENEDSERLLLDAWQMQEEIQDVESLIMSNIYLTKFYLNSGNETKALFHAQAAYRNANEMRSLAMLLESLGLLFELKANTNEEAKIYDQVNKELQTINQSNREIYAVTKYENDKLTTENLVLKAETAKKERQRVIYLFGTIILVLSGGLVFYLLRQRHKREIIRDVYNAEARISKKLHDELANDVYNVMIQIQNDQSNQDILDKLEDIYNSTRDISRENSSFNEGRDFAQELNHMLSGYSGDYTKIIIKDIEEINWQSVTPEKKIIVHRVLQELMINMKKHSHASLVAVTFKKSPKQIKIAYADNGVGVDKEGIMYSNGLRNAENRIKTIGGSFIFESETEKGFKASLRFPN